jgi:vacuolar-type H+-ATPase subunit I/STV1
MTKLHFVKKARKDNPAVKKGESYYWWQFAFSPKQYSATRPRRSQYATQSSYLQQVMDMEDANRVCDDSLIDDIDELKTQIEELQSECEQSLENMPENLQEAETGQLLQERIDACEAAISELENIDTVFDDSDHDDPNEFWENVSTEIDDALAGLSV